MVHDPQSGILSAGQVPGFIKSLKCELITFYQIERLREARWNSSRKTPEDFERYGHFAIASRLYGLFTVGLRVTDTAGLGSGTIANTKHIQDPERSIIWEFGQAGPGFGGQGIHDLLWSFLLRQDVDLVLNPVRENRPVDCFKGPSGNQLEDIEALAYDRSDQAQFTRIMVDGTKPLAIWLRDNGTKMSANFLVPGAEQALPAQMYYQFAVQVSAGVSAKYSLVNPHWSPLAIQANASTTQNSFVNIFINSGGAALAASAKVGAATVPSTTPPEPALGSTPDHPLYVVGVPGAGQGPAAVPEAAPGAPEIKRQPPRQRQRIERPILPGGILLPLPATPPSLPPP
jgi:hypothetical protein